MAEAFAAIPEVDAHRAIAAAFKAGCDAEPSAACAAVVDSLSGRFGPIIQKIVALIQSGLTNLPAILAALTAAGIALPPWVNIVIELLLAIVPKPAPVAA